MGQYISKRAEWRTDTKLKQCVENEALLTVLAETISNLVAAHPAEVQTPFADSVEFPTSVRPADFSSFEDASEYIKSDSTTIVSVKSDSRNRPLFELSRVDRETFRVSVRTLAFLHRHLQHAGERRLAELRAVLEGNRNITRIISGMDGTPGEVLSNGFRMLQSKDGANGAETQAMLALLLVVNEADLRLLSEALDTAKSASTELTIERVSREVTLLQQFCASSLTASSRRSNNDNNSVLTSIDFDKEFVFATGPQAPPWRQVKGELAYITALTVAGDEINITAAKRGYFQNKGYAHDPHGERRLEYAEVGATYPSLVDLLRAVDEHFAATIDLQENIALVEAPMTIKEVDGAAPVNTAEPRSRKKKEKTPRTPRQTGPRSPGRPGDVTAAPLPARWQDLAEHPLEYRPVTAPSAPMEPQPPQSARGRRPLSSRGSGKADKQPKSIYQDSDSEDDDLAELQNPSEKATDYQEYDKIQKLVRVLRSSTETATVLCLVHLLDCQLATDHGQMAVLETGGLETLVNLLTVPFSRCQLGALKVLRVVTKTLRIQASLEQLAGVQPLCDLVRTGSDEIRALAAETLGYCSAYARNRRAIRQYGAIPWIVDLLQLRPAAAVDPIELTRAGAGALWACSKSVKNQAAIRDSGALPLLARLLREVTRDELLVPVVGVIRACADDAAFRAEARESGVVEYLVRYLRSPSEDLQVQCAAALFRCADDELIQLDVGATATGLKSLTKMLFTKNDALLVAATGAVWKCAASIENVEKLVQLDAIGQLVVLINHPHEDVQINAVGALQNCAQEPAVRRLILEGNGIPSLVAKLKDTNRQLLRNVTGAIGACALDANCLKVINANDGVRYLWSLLKYANPEVVTSAAWAICPCIDNGALSGDLVRSFVGGLDLVVGLLKNPDVQVRAAICAVIANIAKDKDNLAVITDHGVVWMLADLTVTTEDHLRKHLAEAISRCAKYRSNELRFGQAGAVPPLVNYLRSADADVHRSTARALYQLSFDANNCVAMHEAGVVEPLLNLIGSADPELQEAASGCVSNIRTLALCNERAQQARAKAA